MYFFHRIIEFWPIFIILNVLNSLYLFCWQLCCNVEIFGHICKSSEWFGIVRIFGLFRTPIFPHHSKHFSTHIKLTICRFWCLYHKMTVHFTLPAHYFNLSGWLYLYIVPKMVASYSFVDPFNNETYYRYYNIPFISLLFGLLEFEF